MDVILPILMKIFEKREDNSIVSVSVSVSEDNTNTMDVFDIPNIIQTQSGFYEDVSDLNGLAIPAIFYDYLMNKHGNAKSRNVLYEMMEQSLCEMKENEHLFLKKYMTNISPYCESPDDYLLMANLYISIQDRLYFRLKQIGKDGYNWLKPEIIHQCISRLDETVGKELVNNENTPIAEFPLIHHSMDEIHQCIDTILSPHFEENVRFRFSAVLDFITEESVWELKCTSMISIDHKLQLVIYAWLWRTMNKPEKKFKLFNIKTNELWFLDASIEQLTDIVIALLKGKHETLYVKSDAEFLEDCWTNIEKSHVYTSEDLKPQSG